LPAAAIALRDDYDATRLRACTNRAQGRRVAARPAPAMPLLWLTNMTTEAFLSHFGFESLRDLPDIERFEDAGLLKCGDAAMVVRAPEPPAGRSRL